MNFKPSFDDIEIIGHWDFDGKKVIKDDNCRRIEWLLNEYFNKMEEDETGWFVLYQDPEDGRFWKLDYPKSESHGGGPPRLKVLSKKEAHYKRINNEKLN